MGAMRKTVEHCLMAVALLASCSTDDTGSGSGADVADDSTQDGGGETGGDAAGIDTPGDGPGSDIPGSDAPPQDTAGNDTSDQGGDTPEPTSDCEPLPLPDGATIVGPDDADDLPGILFDAAPNEVIALEDGTYTFTGGDESSRRLRLRATGVTLRSVSGDASAVVLDAEYLTDELINIEASEVTVAHVTLTHAVNHLIHISPPDGGPDVTGVRIYNVRFLDGGEQFLKVNPPGSRDAWVDGGEVSCSLFRMTDDGRPHVEREPGGCYTGGIDAHSAQGWHVHHNRFEDIYCAGEGLAEHAIHFWVGSRDTLIENNVILGCARGIGFGLVEDGEARTYEDIDAPGYVGHYDGVVRNNVIYADHNYFDTGIELDQALGSRVIHNTVLAGPNAGGFYSSIDYRYPNTDVLIQNNIVANITERNEANGTVSDNLEAAVLTQFIDPDGGDFHLNETAADAIDQGIVLPDPGLDMDGETHDNGAPDLGADER